MAKVKTARKKPASRKARLVSEPEQRVGVRPRRLRLPAYKPFRIKRIIYPEKLPSVWALSAQTFQLFRRRPVLFLALAIINLVLTIALVRGFGNGVDITNLKNQLGLGPAGIAQVLTGVSVFVTLFAVPSTNSGSSSGAYQLAIFVIISLATIWAARQTLAGHRVRLRDAFYRGMTPLFPFLFVLLVVVLESLPLLIGMWLYATVIVDGIAVSWQEHILWAAACLSSVVVSVYMLCSSLFALYIVTLPDMTPIKALKSARELVRYRSGQVLQKLLYLPVALFVLLAIIMVPTIVFAAPAAPWLFFVVTTASLVVIHGYMYTVYKALLT